MPVVCRPAIFFTIDSLSTQTERVVYHNEHYSVEIESPIVKEHDFIVWVGFLPLAFPILTFF